jgi:hypothetical protein
MTQIDSSRFDSPISLTPEEARKVLLAAQGKYPNLTQAKEMARQTFERDTDGIIVALDYDIDIYHGNTMRVRIDRNLDAREAPCSQ